MADMPEQPNAFVKQQHAQVSTPRSVLAELVRRGAGARIERLDRIVEGYENEVYRARCADGQDLVVRIMRFGPFAGNATRSAGEAWAIGQAQAAGLPTPEILLMDTVGIDGSTFPVMVQRTVPGRPLGDVVADLPDYQRHHLLAEIGGLIAKLNEVQVDDDRDWSTAMAAEIAGRRCERDAILAGGFTATQFDQMLDLLEEYAHDFPCERWVLCHGDLGARHIFVTANGKDGTEPGVSGIIDWGDWQPGAPVHDLAVFRVRCPQLDLLPLLRGYGAPADETYRRRLDLHTLDIALSSLWIGVDEGDHACIERSRTLIHTLLGDLGIPGF